MEAKKETKAIEWEEEQQVRTFPRRLQAEGSPDDRKAGKQAGSLAKTPGRDRIHV